ncbi:MAG: glycosyltransferase [Candidatus Omnitrophica bacterium]|nr:glycosyltransferase [Candidatus Omnitrophota bacterium]MDD5352447.1 glycosyltransferase [Candidatus Omnitrophota bacterium]MDD5550045.1 glycosyltransferase [Candidatus Omnitrophota bacterium]
MINNNLTVTVAINTFNRPRDLSKCLDSLSKQSYRNFDVAIVNGGDKKPVGELVKNFNLPIRIIQQGKTGLVEARNLCWRQTHSDIVCIIDDDLVVSPFWLKEIVETFLSDEKIGGVSGPTLISERRRKLRDLILLVKRFEKGNIFWRSLGSFYLNFILEGRVNEVGRILRGGIFTLGSNFPDCLKKEGLLEVDYLEACHMCMRRKLIEEVGGFDYCYGGVGDWSEPDLAFRIKKLGYRLVFNPRAVTEHRVSIRGVFGARTHAFDRSANFITFYFRHIKPDTFQKFIRFYSYLFFINCYWVYKTLETRNLDWLSGISGTIFGLIKNMIPKCLP